MRTKAPFPTTPAATTTTSSTVAPGFTLLSSDSGPPLRFRRTDEQAVAKPLAGARLVTAIPPGGELRNELEDKPWDVTKSFYSVSEVPIARQIETEF